MKPTPLHLIVSRIRPLALPHQIAFLRSMIALERPHSIRRNELESLLAGKITKQLKRENRQERVA
jgi:hypothetical protein